MGKVGSLYKPLLLLFRHTVPKMSLDVSSSTPGSSSGLRQPSARTTPPAPLTKPQSFSPLIPENKENVSASTANRTSPRNKPTIADVSGLKRKADAVPLTARPSVRLCCPLAPCLLALSFILLRSLAFKLTRLSRPNLALTAPQPCPPLAVLGQQPHLPPPLPALLSLADLQPPRRVVALLLL
jgi:hypothetical protein